jgi:hypothetical protein
MRAQNRIEALRMEGLVVEGQYPDMRTIDVSQNGQSRTMEVRPLVLKHADLTVFRPVLKEKI